MDPQAQWQILTLAIILGGHVRVGMEDNPYLSEGVLAKSNAELVEKIVRISRELGREIAEPSEARQIIGIRRET
jgi:3-keto-5-aminohexanoate cleavage enzyme